MSEQKLLREAAMVAMHAMLAADAFKDHVLEEKLSQGAYRHWTCGQPGSSCYRFHVTTVPGRIFVTGDIGDLIVEREIDMIAWCRGSIDSIGYFAKKVPAAIKTRVYDPQVAAEVLAEIAGREQDEDDYGDCELSVEELKDLVDDEHRFCIGLYESGLIDGCDFPTVTCWNSNFLWCREAIKWLLSHLPEGSVAE